MAGVDPAVVKPEFKTHLRMLTPLQDDGSCGDASADENILLHHAGRSLEGLK
jgi:hypothetical protein